MVRIPIMPLETHTPLFVDEGRLDSGFRRNDGKRAFLTFYETINPYKNKKTATLVAISPEASYLVLKHLVDCRRGVLFPPAGRDGPQERTGF
jgi:hypothetical protein